MASHSPAARKSPVKESPIRRPAVVAYAAGTSSETITPGALAAAKARRAQREAQQRNTFKGGDVDGSGGLSADELKAKLNLSEADAVAVLQRFDRNGDGELQFDEFEKAQQALEAQKPSNSGRSSAKNAAMMARVSAAMARTSQAETQREAQKAFPKD